MEIGPIPGIRPIAPVKPRPVDPELSALFDIESCSQADDDAYTASDKKAAGAEEDDENGELEEPSEDPSTVSRDSPSGAQISFFA